MHSKEILEIDIFLGILDLIARYDVTLAEHLRKAASKKTSDIGPGALKIISLIQ